MMEEDLELQRPLDLKPVFKRAFAMYKSNAQIFLAIGLLYGLTSVSSGIFIGKASQEISGLIFFINVLLTCIASLLVIGSVLQISRNKPVLLANNLIVVRQFYFAFAAVSLSQMLVSAVGMMFLIIPGVYCLVVFVFADIVIVTEGKKYLEAFQESAGLTQGYFWPIFMFICILAGVSILPVILTELLMPVSPQLANSLNTAATVLISPFLMLAQMQLYFQVKKIRNS